MRVYIANNKESASPPKRMNKNSQFRRQSLSHTPLLRPRALPNAKRFERPFRFLIPLLIAIALIGRIPLPPPLTTPRQLEAQSLPRPRQQFRHAVKSPLLPQTRRRQRGLGILRIRPSLRHGTLERSTQSRGGGD